MKDKVERFHDLIFEFNDETACATYLIDCEYIMWELRTGKRSKEQFCGRDGKFPELIWNDLLEISEELSKWFYWDDGMNEEELIPIADFIPKYEKWSKEGNHCYAKL